MVYKTQRTFAGNGTQTIFNFAMDYLRKSFMTLRIDGVLKEYGVDYLITGQEMTILVAPPAGAVVYIKRVTTTDKLVTWTDSSVLFASDLTLFETQLLHLTEEEVDRSTSGEQYLQEQIDILVNPVEFLEKLEEVKEEVETNIQNAIEDAQNIANEVVTISVNASLEATQSASSAKLSESNSATSAASALDYSNSASSSANAANLAAQNIGTLAFTTVALMNADLAHAVNTICLVTNGPTPTSNGQYIKLGASGVGSWQKSAYIPPVADESVAPQKTTFDIQKALKSIEPYLKDNTIATTGTHSSYKNLSSGYTITGWKYAITYDGSAFNAVRVNLHVYVDCDVTVTIWDKTGVSKITSKTRKVTAGAGSPVIFILPITVSHEITSDSFLYVSVESVGRTALIDESNMTPVSNTPALSTYYCTSGQTADTWTAGTATIYLALDCILLDLKTINDLVAPITAIEGVKTPVSVCLSDVTYIQLRGDANKLMGYGAIFNYVSAFNMVRIPILQKDPTTSSKTWTYIEVEVRDSSQVGTVIAKGISKINPSLSFIEDGVEIALHTPVTQIPITVDNTLIPSGKYFIGYTALQESKVFSAVVTEVVGTMSNYTGVSFYKYSAAFNPSATWSPFVNNPSMAIETYNVSSLVDRTVYQPLESFKVGTDSNIEKRLDALEHFETLKTLPPKIYGVVGKEVNIYYDNLVSDDTDEINIDVVSSVGTQQNERYTLVPASAGIFALTLDSYKKNSETKVQSVTSSLIISSATAGSGLTKKLLCIGDSTTQGAGSSVGGYPYWLSQILNGISDLLTVTMLGTQGTAPHKHEGYGGTTVAWHYTNSSSPFVFSGAFNFSQYMSTHGYADVDFITIHLGINDIFGKTLDSEVDATCLTAFAQLEAMITNIHAFNSDIKIGVCVSIPPSKNQDAFGNNYQCGQTKWRYKRNVIRWTQNLITQFKGREGSNIYLIPLNVNLDTVNNMQVGTSLPVNSRSSVSTTRQDNGVHPADPGYGQMADSIYYWIKNMV